MNNNFVRTFFTTTNRFRKVAPNNIKGKGTSSTHWLTRQLSDPYVEKTKLFNYRCRSAFKLIEMDDRYHFLRPGQVVVDCGAAPGSWTQVAVERVNAKGVDPSSPTGVVISIDKQHIHPIEGAILIGNADLTTSEAQSKLQSLLGDRKPNCVISDMAPTATGVKELDTENIMDLCYSALRFAILVSSINASLIVKLWQCGATKTLENDMLKYYESVKVVKPQASRSDSSEVFLLGRNFKGLKQ